MIHLDTNIVIAFLNGDQRIAAKLHSAIPDVAISSLVLAELLYGAARSGRPEDNSSKIAQLRQLISVVPFDIAAATAFAKLKLDLRKRGKPTGEVDALIAATCLACNATLVTHNSRHFEHIGGLSLDDWLA